jgi:anti-sigma factor RsiW
MACKDTSDLLHALLDGELDAGNARKMEAHVATCLRCESDLRAYRWMRRSMAAASMSYQAPAGLRRRLAGPPRVATSAAPSTNGSARRYTLRGFAMGGILSSAIAACLMLFVVQNQADQRIVGDAISAHLRAVQGQHLMDVVSTDEQAVKPWFNGRLDTAPPVIDLRALGCALVGGRIDYVNGAPVAAIVYRRGDHVINLFVSQAVKSGGRRNGREGAGPQRMALGPVGSRLCGRQRCERRGVAGIRPPVCSRGQGRCERTTLFPFSHGMEVGP